MANVVGYPYKRLEELGDEIDTLRAQRDALLAALLDIMERPFIVTAMEPHIADRARAAIAKARGQL